MKLRSTTLLGSLLCAALAPALPALAADAAAFHLKASYDRPGLPVPKWQFRIDGDGKTEYTAERTATAGPDAPTSFVMSAAGVAKLSKLLEESHGLQPCETRTKGLARMGIKTLEYQNGSAAAVQCSFNFTDNKPLGAVVEYLIATSFTIEQGAVLERLHRYDRLGLDPVMTQLAVAVKEGRAQELGAIQATLQSLAGDDQVLERVREKAASLLSLVPKS